MEMNFQCNQINSHYIQHILSRCFLGRRTTGSNPVTLDPKGSLFTIMDSSGSQPFGLEEVKDQDWRAREGWGQELWYPLRGTQGGGT